MTLVVSPLIALMKDQIDFLARAGHRRGAARLDASTRTRRGPSPTGCATGSCKLLYVAPERFDNERFLAQLGQAKIALFAVDEAHCISEWGHNFRPDYLKLAARARELGAERVLALTATATPAVVADICAGFEIERARRRRHRLLPPEPRRCSPRRSPRDERDARCSSACAQRAPGPTIVYVTLQRTAERVAALLRRGGPARARLPRGHETPRSAARCRSGG